MLLITVAAAVIVYLLRNILRGEIGDLIVRFLVLIFQINFNQIGNCLFIINYQNIGSQSVIFFLLSIYSHNYYSAIQ